MDMFDNLSEDIYAALFEFVGTTLFLFLGLGGIQASAAEELSVPGSGSNVIKVFYIATCMGMSLLVTAWLFFRITGAVFNPNISLALCLVGAISPVRFVLYTVAQLVGGIAAGGLVRGLVGGLDVNTSLHPGISHAQGVFIEMFITSALVFSVLMLAVEKHAATPLAPIGIGLTLFSGHLFAVFFTGAAMNTARAFGPAVVTGFPSNQHWVYWVGPYLGSLLGTGLYLFLKHARYTRLNPGQDSQAADPEKSPHTCGHLSQTIPTSPIRSEGQTVNGLSSEVAVLEK